MSPRKRRPFATLRWGGALLAAIGLVALTIVDVGPAASARADSSGSGYDQMNGTGTTASAITVPWTAGLLDSSNQALDSAPGTELNSNQARQAGTGPYAFMDHGVLSGPNKGFGAFNTLQVSVSQTQGIGHGGITVSWTGAQPTNEASFTGGFLQIMECYGNAPTGPSPEDCEFGQGKIPAGRDSGIGGRIGSLCATPTLSPTNPTGTMNGGGPSLGCDPYEPTTGTPTHYPCTSTNGGVPNGPDCIPGDFSVPFVPKNGAPAVYQNQQELTQAFDQYSTNEVDFATSSCATPNCTTGSGQQQFETLTSAQSAALGCGQQQSDGSPQGCWLVIVPRGIYEPNGYDTSQGDTTQGIVQSSPLSGGNWAQRIQVHLDYAPLPNFCPLGGTARESLMEGSQLVTRAVQSWELKLNQDANCALIYHLADTSEQQVTNDFTLPVTPGVPGNGLAFTTDPIGSDRLRSGEPAPTLPNTVYAPVAVMGLDFGFHIDEQTGDSTKQSGYLSTPVRLSPQLLARAVTQSYLLDLTDYAPTDSSDGPSWAAHNPLDMSIDPQFGTLNPKVASAYAFSTAPLDTVDHSAYYQEIWQWLQADSSTSQWLDGGSNSGVTIDPSYESQKLGTAPAIDSMPRTYPCANIMAGSPPAPQSRCSTDVNPYVANFDAASADVLAGNPLTYTTNWDPTALNPSTNAEGYWTKNPVESPGGTWEWAVDATPYTAAYGIVPAQLCDDSGSSCIGPTVASVTAAVNNAKPDSDGLLQVNPASPGAGAYPLTEVIYAAVRTDMPAQALTDYADFISFATGQGQTPGQAGGDLPAGYLPLTASLQAQATAAVNKLRAIAAGGPTSTPTATATSTSTSGGNGNGNGNGAGTGNGNGAGNGTNGNGNGAGNGNGGTQPAVAPNAGTSPGSTTRATSSGYSTPTGPVVVPPTVAIAPAGNTPSQPVGPVRLALAVVVIIGLGGAGGGILLRRGRLPRWPGRWGP